jgi:predicted PurR-regulated permease PerM
VLTFSIVLPMFFVFLAILRQGIVYSNDLYNWVSSGGLELLMSHEWVVDLLARLKEWVPEDLLNPEKVAAQLMASASSVGKNILDLGARVAGDVSGFLVSFLLMLFVLFFVLRDYDRMFAFARHALPLSRSQEDVLLKEILDVSKSALLGSFLTALSQGIAGGIGLWLAGFPGLFWGTFMAFSSLVPVVGTALVWLPAAVYLLFTGEWGWGLFLMIWGVLVVGSIDNFLRPWFMQGSSSMSALIIFFSLLGGIHLYGLMGLLYGPIIFAVTLVLFRLYEQEFKEFLDYQDRH